MDEEYRLGCLPVGQDTYLLYQLMQSGAYENPQPRLIMEFDESCRADVGITEKISFFETLIARIDMSYIHTSVMPGTFRDPLFAFDEIMAGLRFRDFPIPSAVGRDGSPRHNSIAILDHMIQLAPYSWIGVNIQMPVLHGQTPAHKTCRSRLVSHFGCAVSILKRNNDRIPGLLSMYLFQSLGSFDRPAHAWLKAPLDFTRHCLADRIGHVMLFAQLATNGTHEHSFAALSNEEALGMERFKTVGEIKLARSVGFRVLSPTTKRSQWLNLRVDYEQANFGLQTARYSLTEYRALMKQVLTKWGTSQLSSTSRRGRHLCV